MLLQKQNKVSKKLILAAPGQDTQVDFADGRSYKISVMMGFEKIN